MEFYFEMMLSASVSHISHLCRYLEPKYKKYGLDTIKQTVAQAVNHQSKTLCKFTVKTERYFSGLIFRLHKYGEKYLTGKTM